MTTVKTQEELDAAIERGNQDIVIRSECGVWLYVSGSATVRVSGSATVRVSGSATVRVSGSATVRASGSATVRAWGSATVEAGKYVAVHLFSQRVKLTGGVLIDMTQVDATKTQDWIDLTGADVADQRITVYKAVRDDYKSAHGTTYTVGQEVSCDDFQPTANCGSGLHFSPSPTQALGYDSQATRFLECQVLVAEVQGLDSSKLKAPRCWVIREVDQHGRAL